MLSFHIKWCSKTLICPSRWYFFHSPSCLTLYLYQLYRRKSSACLYRFWWSLLHKWPKNDRVYQSAVIIVMPIKSWALSGVINVSCCSFLKVWQYYFKTQFILSNSSKWIAFKVHLWPCIRKALFSLQIIIVLLNWNCSRKLSSIVLCLQHKWITTFWNLLSQSQAESKLEC